MTNQKPRKRQRLYVGGYYPPSTIKALDEIRTKENRSRSNMIETLILRAEQNGAPRQQAAS